MISLSQISLIDLLSDKCKAPDHSLITVRFKFDNVQSDNLNGSYCEIDNDTLRGIGGDGKTFKKYLFKNVSKQFMDNNVWNLAFKDLLNRFEEYQLAQESIDTMYTELCRSIYSEMAKYLKCNSTERTKTRKQMRLSKPYWNVELTNKWMTMKNCEKIYLKCINVNQRKYNRESYLKSRREFDKYLRLCERKYRNETVDKNEKIT